MERKPFTITGEKIKEYELYLAEEERTGNTIKKYIRDINAFAVYLDGENVGKEYAINWKNKLKETHAAASIELMLAAVNGFFAFFGLGIKVKALRVQKNNFLPADKELTKEDYEKLLEAAKSSENDRLYHIIQSICATGIRVGELPFITVEAVKTGRAEVTNKGKTRIVLIPDDLRGGLVGYIKRNNIKSGHVFITKSGNPMDRSNIWAEMKKLCASAGVDEKKVYPHNLRTLFSRMVHSADNDLAILADILGHSDLSTTRVYVRENTARYRMIIENLGLARMRYKT